MHYFVGQGKKEAEKAFENVTGKCAAGKTEVGNLYDRHRPGCRNG
jgi:hypothetical protein